MDFSPETLQGKRIRRYFQNMGGWGGGQGVVERRGDKMVNQEHCTWQNSFRNEKIKTFSDKQN